MFAAPQSELLCSPYTEQKGSFWFCSRQGKHSCTFHCRCDANSAVYTAGCNIKCIQVASAKYIFVGILGSLHHSNYVVEFYRTHLEVVSYVKLQLEILPSVHHLGYLLVLVFVQFYVGDGWKGLPGHLHAVFSVIKSPDWNR